ncbi:WXG100 family type VII secretion target [Gulosibacter bifidus]|uniref:ESAT-6-like protein n=1 Tax=Gulosibacter bifidus TaxID=272239 RepID=A0ABW5RJL3_9MICO|nr:WXG100 family type VII secretion target [Gulosibacter bifidus]
MSQTFTGEGAIEAGASAADDARQNLSSIVSRLQGEMEAIRPQFQGAAANAFQSAMGSWSENAEKIISTLDQFSSDLRGTQADITSTDDDRASAMANQEEAGLVNFSYPGA